MVAGQRRGACTDGGRGSQHSAAEGRRRQDHARDPARRRVAGRGPPGRDARRRSAGEPVHLVQPAPPPARRRRGRPRRPGPLGLAARRRARPAAARVRPGAGRHPAARRDRCPQRDPRRRPDAPAVPAERARRLGVEGDPRSGRGRRHQRAAGAQPGALAQPGGRGGPGRDRGRALAARRREPRQPPGLRGLDRRGARRCRERARQPCGQEIAALAAEVAGRLG